MYDNSILLPQLLAAESNMPHGVIGVLVGAGLFAAVMLLILLMISRSINEMRRGADRFAHGDLSQRIAIQGPLQLSGLAEALNQMAKQLQDRLSTVVQQRNELGAVLSSMAEGVVAVDLDERVLSLNRAAAELLDLDPSWAIGRSIQEVVRNSALQTFVAQTLSTSSDQQAEFMFNAGPARSDGPRFLEAQSAILHDAGGRRIGAVVVLHDVTSLRRLEAVRRDFVANVSHELKTPISAVKAAVETILDELHEDADQQDIERFLAIIARQSDRLAAIVEDLLSLARIEAGATQIAAELLPGNVASVIAAAREACSANAQKRQMAIETRCNPNLEARMNQPLFEQALVNLIDNAIKYSPEKTHVEVSAELVGQEVIVSVRDQGRGIEPEHLPRIFERFYRTDKARSRAMGGTGLGLSIVKHIAEAHRGRVSVDSMPGKGSTFRIHINTGSGSGRASRSDGDLLRND